MAKSVLLITLDLVRKKGKNMVTEVKAMPHITFSYLTTVKTHSEYFIQMNGLDGSRHYSQNFDSFEAAHEEFEKYKGLLSYFGNGGYIRIYEIIDNDAVVIFQEIV